MKKAVLIGLFLLLACSNEETIKIGVLAPQTGVAAHLGEQMMQGITIAREETKSYHLIVEDDQCDPKEGVKATKKLIEKNNVDIIIGSICTVSILSSSPLVEEAKVPRITTGMVLQTTANAGDYHFSFLPEMQHQMHAITTYAKQQGIQTISTLAINDELGRESIIELKKAAKEKEITILHEEYFDKQTTDFRSLLIKATSEQPDAIYLMGYAPHFIPLVQQTKELHIEQSLLSWNLYQDPNVIKALGKLAEKVVYSYPEDPRNLTVKTTFQEVFRKQFKEEPGLYAANGYDSYLIATKALDTCKKDKECIKQYLYQINIEGANGFIVVDERGIGQRAEVAIKTVRNKTFITLPQTI